jgi:AcrR family transcriptional regulator
MVLSIATQPLIYTARIAPAEEPLSTPPDPRRRILDALVETAVREGYAHTCIERVCSVANVSAAVFGEHFESIQDCFIQANDELIGELELVVLRDCCGEEPWPQRIRRGLSALLSVISKHPDRARFVMIECPQAGEQATERMRCAEDVFVAVLEEGIQCAASVEHLSVESSEGIVGGIAAIIHKRVLEENTAELPALLADLLYFALMPYLGHEDALAAA